MLNRNEDTIIYMAEIGGTEYELEIAYTMGVDWDHNDQMVSIVESWRVYKIAGKTNALGEFWAEQISHERVCDAIMEQETA